ncbi:hypothetical protein JXA88_18350 [Candidatus Fermentibacteria bacterium]|nr:hypothetical protein [Candidatus Fermentibacteria bacterium]
MQDKRTMLLNWLYYRPVGHAVESFAAAADYYAPDKNLRVSVLLNSETPFELAANCPWIHAAYPVNVDDVAEKGTGAQCLEAIPRVWDYVVTSERRFLTPHVYTGSMARCQEVIDEFATARMWKGIRGQVGEGIGPIPDCVPFAKFRMVPHDAAKRWVAAHANRKPIFTVMLGGASGAFLYPRVETWISILKALRQRFPAVCFAITGSTDSSARRNTTLKYSKQDVGEIVDKLGNAIDCYDIGIDSQLALLEASDLFVSAHTGFAFLAPCVGTPWLAVSGAHWPDPAYARNPFYSVLPTCPEYPCYTGMLPECQSRKGRGEPVYCMDTALESRIPEIVEGAARCLDPTFDLAQAAQVYELQAKAKGVKLERMYTLDMLRAHMLNTQDPSAT